MAEGRAAVIAVGNLLRADDGAGVEVVRRLAGRVPAGVCLIELGGEPAELLDAWDDLETVVVVDAVRTGGKPGTVHQFDASTAPLPAHTGGASTHGLGLADALELGRALDRLPARVVVVGIEVADDRTVGGELSRPVQDAIADAVAGVLAELQRGRGDHAYADFSQTSDAEVKTLLEQGRAEAGPPRAGPPEGEPPESESVCISVGRGRSIEADLVVPPVARGLVIFAHGSGSSRHSARNRYVASVLQQGGLATLLLDLLTPEEELDRGNVFDIAVLARRLLLATRWAAVQPATRELPVAYFGASTGAGAALVAAAQADLEVRGVVSRGGRPDLAAPHLADVRAPVLLIVGGNDRVVLDLNREAAAQLGGPHELVVVPGATHLFEEPGALETVARHVCDWLVQRLAT